MMDFVAEYFTLQILHAVSIDVLSHPDIFLHNWGILYNVVINRMYYLLYFLDGDVM